MQAALVEAAEREEVFSKLSPQALALPRASPRYLSDPQGPAKPSWTSTAQTWTCAPAPPFSSSACSSGWESLVPALKPQATESHVHGPSPGRQQAQEAPSRPLPFF